MEKEKVESANTMYLITGAICSGMFVFGLIWAIQIIINKQYGVLFIMLILLLTTLGMSFLMIGNYKNRKEFYNYSLKIKGCINFDEINKDFIQIKNTTDTLYFVEKKDYGLYQSYSILNH
jgi:hypothetical protein